MFFGITIEKVLLVALIAGLIIGPERLPRYAEAFSGWVKRSRDWVTNAKTRVRDEMGEDFNDVDWRTLDPRQYDPRRIIREALLDDAPVQPVKPARPLVATPPVVPASVPSPFRAGEQPPFDPEAT